MQNNTRNSKAKAVFLTLALPLGVLAVIFGGLALFGTGQYYLFALLVVLITLLVFFSAFEKRQTGTRVLALVAAMTALSVAGRFAFAFVSGFKPVTAIVVITAAVFGKEAGFLTGSMSALLSNFYFGQGPWTPFQMFCWGLIGFLAGVLSGPLKRSKLLICLYGAFAGVLYSVMIDFGTMLWMDGGVNLPRYLGLLASSLPVLVMYPVSNIIFLFFLSKPIGKKLERVQTKYGLKSG